MDAAEQSDGRVEPINVLFVEDYPVQARLVRDILSRRAPNVLLDHVASVGEALQRLRAFKTESDTMAAPAADAGTHIPRYDVVLVDLGLPDGSGLEVLAYVRSRRLPLAVVMLTGASDHESAESALRAGADAYVAKHGTYLGELAGILHSALQRYRAGTSQQLVDPPQGAASNPRRH